MESFVFPPAPPTSLGQTRTPLKRWGFLEARLAGSQPEF